MFSRQRKNSGPNFSNKELLNLSGGSGFSGHYDKDEILGIIHGDLRAAKTAWSVLPNFDERGNGGGRSLADLFGDDFKGNGESVHGGYCPVCNDPTADDRCKLQEGGTLIYCRTENKKYDVFCAIREVMGCQYSDAVDMVGKVLAGAGYSIRPRMTPKDIKNAVNSARGGGVRLIQTGSELAAPTINPPTINPPTINPPTINPPTEPTPLAEYPPKTFKRLPVLPVWLDVSNWKDARNAEQIKIQRRPGAANLPTLHVETRTYYYAKSGTTAPKGRAELFDDQGTQYAFYDAATGPKLTTKKIKNATGADFSKADPYDLRQLVPKVERILIVESEKTVDIVNELYKGKTIALALNGSSGARHWGRHADRFAGRSVIICADMDADSHGLKAARDAAESLLTAEKPLQEVGIFSPIAPGGLDTFDGYGVDNLIDDLRQQNGGYDDGVITTLNDLLSQAPKFNLETLPPKQNKSAGAVAIIDQDDDLSTPAGGDLIADQRDAQERRRQIEEAKQERRLKLDLEIETLTDFDFNRLPGVFDFALALADKYRVNPMAEVFPHLTALTNFIGQKFAVYDKSINDWEGDKLFPRLHTILLGGSNSGKSPIIKAAIDPIKAIQIDIAKDLERQRKDQEETANNREIEIGEQLEQLREEIEAAKEAAKKAGNKKGTLTPDQKESFKKRKKELTAERTRINQSRNKKTIGNNPLFISDDTTGEAILLLLALMQRAGYWEGVNVATDEAAGLFSVTNDAKQVLKQFKLYTAIGEPGGAIPNRKTATTDNATNYNVVRMLTTGYLFGCQLKIFGAYLDYDLLRDQGYANRFFKFHLRDDREDQKEITIDPLLYTRYAHPFNWLRSLPVIDDAPYILQLSADAQNVFRQYRQTTETRKKELMAKGLTDEAAFFGKTNSYVLSIAATLKVIDLSYNTPNGTPLDADTLQERGICLLINGATMELAADIATAAEEDTLAAMRAVRDAVNNPPDPPTKTNKVDDEVLNMLKSAGADGLTFSPFQIKYRIFKGDEGKKSLEITIRKLIDKGYVKSNGLIGKRGTKYFYVEMSTANQDDDQDDDQDE